MVRTQCASKIAGGFVLVPVATLLAVWRGTQSKPLGIGDFRAWLACHEMVARRCNIEDDRPASFGFPELARLLDVTERRARESVGRLVQAGLLEWSAEAIGFPSVFTHTRQKVDDLDDTIGRGRGSVAIPRRMLRFLASGARPALIGTVLGILLRCLSRRRGGFEGRGRVKASWVAEVFHLGIRQIKAARRELVDLGWIEGEPSDQWSWNRWGRAFRIDLGWEAPRNSKGAPGAPFNHGEIPCLGARSTPLPADPCAPSAPPDQTPIPSGIEKTPGTRPGATGARLDDREKVTDDNTCQVAPNLSNVRPEDLRETARTLKLFDQAVAKGLVGSSEHDRLRFLALAEHARGVGTVNPGGLFASLLRRGAWSFVTQGEEDAARRRLREHLRGQERPPGRPAARVSTFVPDKPEAGPSGLGSVLGNLMARFGA